MGKCRCPAEHLWQRTRRAVKSVPHLPPTSPYDRTTMSATRIHVMPPVHYPCGIADSPALSRRRYRGPATAQARRREVWQTLLRITPVSLR